MTPYQPTNIPDRLKGRAYVRIRVEGLYPFRRWDMLASKEVSPPITGPGIREESVQLVQFALCGYWCRARHYRIPEAQFEGIR